MEVILHVVLVILALVLKGFIDNEGLLNFLIDLGLAGLLLRVILHAQTLLQELN